MNATLDALLNEAAEAIAGQGWWSADALPEAFWRSLHAEAARRFDLGDYRPATVGSARLLRRGTRSDSICWLDPDRDRREFSAYWELVESVRRTMNRSLMLGLERFEAHLACYAPGAFYARHLDCLRGDDRRRLTMIVYLNPDWSAGDGGMLRLYLEDGTHRDLPPEGGRIVLFLSDRFEHEVLPAKRRRFAITGWFLRRPLGGPGFAIRNQG